MNKKLAVLTLFFSGLSVFALDRALEDETGSLNEAVLTYLGSSSPRTNFFVSGMNLAVLRNTMEAVGYPAKSSLLSATPRLLPVLAPPKGELGSPFKVSALVASAKATAPSLSCPVTALKLDLSRPESFLEMNTWAKDFTHGRVTDPFRAAEEELRLMDERTQYVASLSYLRTHWKDENLREADGEEMTFTLPGSKTLKLPAVRSNVTVESARYGDFEVFTLELAKTKVFKVAIVTGLYGPPLTRLKVSDWDLLRAKLATQYSEVVMPAFLSGLLNELSTYSLILPHGTHDTGAILSKEVQRHAQNFRVIPRGTEAKAATAKLEIGIVPATPHVVASPFYFFIYHVETGALVSAYRISDPTQVLVGLK